MDTLDTPTAADAILLAGEPDALEAWKPEEFDHFTDLGLLRRDGGAFDAD